MNLLKAPWEYLRKQQPPLVRHLHILIVCLVLCQIIVSNFMGYPDTDGVIYGSPGRVTGTWIHLGGGILLLPLTFLFIVIELRRHGFGYFFPYLRGNLAQIKADLQQLLRVQLPEPEPQGLAAVVQGLGLGAMTLVLLSGFVWFLSWRTAAPWANGAMEVHRALAGLVIVYIVGHGGMGVTHILLKTLLRKNRP